MARRNDWVRSQLFHCSTFSTDRLAVLFLLFIPQILATFHTLKTSWIFQSPRLRNIDKDLLWIPKSRVRMPPNPLFANESFSFILLTIGLSWHWLWRCKCQNESRFIRGFNWINCTGIPQILLLFLSTIHHLCVLRFWRSFFVNLKISEIFWRILNKIFRILITFPTIFCYSILSFWVSIALKRCNCRYNICSFKWKKIE